MLQGAKPITLDYSHEIGPRDIPIKINRHAVWELLQSKYPLFTTYRLAASKDIVDDAKVVLVIMYYADHKVQFYFGEATIEIRSWNEGGRRKKKILYQFENHPGPFPLSIKDDITSKWSDCLLESLGHHALEIFLVPKSS